MNSEVKPSNVMALRLEPQLIVDGPVTLDSDMVNILLTYITHCEESFDLGCTAVEQNRTLWEMTGFLQSTLMHAITAQRGDLDLGRETTVKWMGVAQKANVAMGKVFSREH